jgi:hypothetical protein
MNIINTGKISQLKLAIFMVIASALMLVAVPSIAHASIKDDVCSGVGLSSGGTCDTAQADSKSVNEVVQIGLNLFSSIVGVIAIVMVIIGGVKYMTSQGETGKINEAKNSILYALIGLVIVALAQVIVRFVLTRFT